MAILIHPDGSEAEVHPFNPKKGFTLAELYHILNCGVVQMIHLANGKQMWMDENGKFNPRLVSNPRATLLLQEHGGMVGDYIVGSVLVCEPGEVQ